MKKNKILLKKIWEIRFKKVVYSCAISNLIGDPSPEIIGCSFDETMRIYNLQGKQIMSSEFSSEITCLMLASITQEDEVELISGDINGNIRVMNKQGNLLWNVKLKSAIICMDIGDFNDDGQTEIIVGLQNKKLVFINNQGDILTTFIAPEMVTDCTTIDYSHKLLGNLLVLLKTGALINYDKKGRWQELFLLESNPTSLKSLIIKNEPYLLIGNKMGSLKVLDLEGYILGEIQLEDKIRCINRILSISENEDYNFITAAASNILYLIQYKLAEKKTEVKPVWTKKIKEQEIEIDSEIKQEISITKNDKASITLEEKFDGVKVTRGGQIQGDRYIFKIKVINERNFNITDVNIQILSYPSESLTLIREKDKNESPMRTLDRIKINKITKGGFISPTFIFLPKSDCIKGVIKAVVNYINEKDEVKTIVMEPYDIRVICGLLKPKPITLEEFEKFSQDIINFEKVGEEIEILMNPNLLYEKLLVLLKKKNFAIVDTEKQTIGRNFFGLLKAFAQGVYSKNSLGLQITISGNIREKTSLLKIETFAEDKDMSPALIAEIQDTLYPRNCPECGESIPMELLRKLLKEEQVFCEECGAPLINKY